MRWLKPVRDFFSLVLDKRPAYRSAKIEDAPDVPDPLTIYLIGDHQNPWCAIFVCPCGCGETISLSLIVDDSPSWRAKFHHDETISISPSVWRTRGCKSHFFIRRGKVLWARERSRSRLRSANRV
jgi:hypothetical protein